LDCPTFSLARCLSRTTFTLLRLRFLNALHLRPRGRHLRGRHLRPRGRFAVCNPCHLIPRAIAVPLPRALLLLFFVPPVLRCRVSCRLWSTGCRSRPLWTRGPR
jgi:hypothetical protein